MSVIARILSCCALVIATSLATPVMAQTQSDEAAPSGSSLCIDHMETEPDYGDLEAMPVTDTVDGGCLASLEPIST